MTSKIVGVFVEDFAQEQYIIELCRKVAAINGIELEFETYISRGGRAAVLAELRTFFRLQSIGHQYTDYIVVGNDGNCQGHVSRRNEVLNSIPEAWRSRTALAIPDPHIEAWLFRDLPAFHRAVGQCNAPPQRKCDKDFYKRLLQDRTLDAAGYVNLGGIENAEAIVKEQSLTRLRQSGTDLRNLIADLQRLNADH